MSQSKQEKPRRKVRGKTPLWALRLAGAIQYAGIVDKRGNVDKKRASTLFSVGPKTIESWITGRTQPRFEKLMKIREITRVSLDWILTDRPIAPITVEPALQDEPIRVMKFDKK